MKQHNLFAVTIALILAFTLQSCGDKNKDDKEIVTAAFSTNTSSVEVGGTVNFINESENAKHYQWNFGDGNYSFETDPSHTYNLGGVYLVSLVAIGSDDTDTARSSITVSADVTIFDGQGVKEIALGNSYANVISTFSSDSSYYRDYSTDYQIYSHTIVYPNEGLAFVFLSLSGTLTSSDLVYYIYVFYPYAGTTLKGISLGNTIAAAKTAYGTPEDTYTYTDAIGYAYPSVGIDFYEFDGSGYVEEIDLYPASVSISANSDSNLDSQAKSYLNKNGVALRNRIIEMLDREVK